MLGKALLRYVCVSRALLQLQSLQALRVRHTSTLAIKQCYAVLGVTSESSQAEVKDAFLNLAKRFHPDSQNDTANAEKFNEVEQAYRSIVKHRESEAELSSEQAQEEEQIIFDIRHTAPQHRQYLSNEGIGFGTPSQRQRQYEQWRVSKASENVFEYRMQKQEAESAENALVTKDKRAAKKIKTRFGMDRLVDDLIQESMQKGEFDNLSGRGKRLDYSQRSPHLDVAEYTINRIVIDNDCAPDWIMIQSEIKKDMAHMRSELLRARTRLGAEPHVTARDQATWSLHVNKAATRLEDINTKIHRLNLIVPAMHLQIMPKSLPRELSRSLAEYREKRDRCQLPGLEPATSKSAQHVAESQHSGPAYSFYDMLRHLKELFMKSGS